MRRPLVSFEALVTWCLLSVQFHIDGHSDAAPPYNASLLPLFRWPRDPEEIRGMMQANDVFIVVSGDLGVWQRRYFVS